MVKEQLLTVTFVCQPHADIEVKGESERDLTHGMA